MAKKTESSLMVFGKRKNMIQQDLTQKMINLRDRSPSGQHNNYAVGPQFLGDSDVNGSSYLPKSRNDANSSAIRTETREQKRHNMSMPNSPRVNTG